MHSRTPFFKVFGPLLFGKSPVSPLAEAFAKFSENTSLSQLRKVFGAFIPQSLLAPSVSGANSRKRLFSLDVIFWSFLDQVQSPGASCREAVRKVQAFSCRKVPPQKEARMSARTTSYCKARAKIPLDVLDGIQAHLVDRIQTRIPHNALWHGRHVKLVDGTGISMPDTPENQASWPQSKGQKPGCGFPAINLVGIFCLLTGALIKTAHSTVTLPESLPVRVVRYTIAHHGFRTQVVTIITTLLDADLPASGLADLYFRRWRIELHFKEIKIHLKMDVLRCLSPHMVERELRMHFIAYNLIRCVMQKAALTHDTDLVRLSFKGCLDTLRHFANAACGADDKPRTISALIDEMLLVIASDIIPLRPFRTEPRVRKRRPKNYRLMTKPRREIGPLPHRKTGVENPPKSRLS